MKNLLTSASKLVFLTLAFSACVGFFIGILSQDNFMLLCTGAFAFYFSAKGEADKPFAGK